MIPQFDEVLLTAYLDDEVTEEERAIVVEELRTSEASRRLLEELRSVRNLVVQLHLLPPTRRFEQGPWNAAAVPEANAVAIPIDTPKVVLNKARWFRRMPLQRLASLAALIAIAVCASFLMIGPNTKSISQSGGTTADKSVFAKPLEKFGNNVALEVSETEGLIVVQPNEIGAATAMKRGRDEAKSGSAAPDSFNGTRPEAQDESTTRGSGGKMQSKAFSRELEYDSKKRQAGEPANLPAATPSPGISKPKPANQSSGQVNELATATESLADFSLQIVEDMEKLNRSKTTESSDFSKRILYRYEANKIEPRAGQSLAEKTEASPMEKQLLKSSSADLGKKPSTEVDGIERESILIEFQIPSESWELGTKQLRMLGMDIPEKLPVDEFLDFRATLNETTDDLSLDQFVVDLKGAKENVASNWQFLTVAPQQKVKNRESETSVKETAKKDEKDKQKRSSPRAIQIRVRPI